MSKLWYIFHILSLLCAILNPYAGVFTIAVHLFGFFLCYFIEKKIKKEIMYAQKYSHEEKKVVVPLMLENLSLTYFAFLIMDIVINVVIYILQFSKYNLFKATALTNISALENNILVCKILLIADVLFFLISFILLLLKNNKVKKYVLENENAFNTTNGNPSIIDYQIVKIKEFSEIKNCDELPENIKDMFTRDTAIFYFVVYNKFDGSFSTFFKFKKDFQNKKIFHVEMVTLENNPIAIEKVISKTTDRVYETIGGLQYRCDISEYNESIIKGLKLAGYKPLKNEENTLELNKNDEIAVNIINSL